MSHQSELIATNIEAYLAQHEHKELLRFLTCGSVDDGNRVAEQVCNIRKRRRLHLGQP
jgi:hypothetical protein